MSFSTADLCDEFAEQLQIAEPLFVDFGNLEKFSGQIETIKCFEDNSLVKEAVERDGSNKVLIVDGGGSLRHSLLGDMLAEKALKNGWQGIVINGCVRDVEVLCQLQLGIKALNVIPLKTEKRGEGQKNIAVRFAGVSFRPGDYLYADRNGIVVAARPLL
jgi:regulator of ribonuclease activity A